MGGKIRVNNKVLLVHACIILLSTHELMSSLTVCPANHQSGGKEEKNVLTTVTLMDRKIRDRTLIKNNPLFRVGREWMALVSSCDAAEMREDRWEERGRCRLKFSEFHSKDADDVTAIDDTVTVVRMIV